jgi:phosphoglycolate phosphatase-like HAD superfamily hydrolase
MSINNYHDKVTKKDYINKAKPLDKTIKINPETSMVMFNLRGTLIRNGILLRKVLKHISGKAIDKVIGNNQETFRIPLVHNISSNLELIALENKNEKTNLTDIFEPKKILSIVEKALLSHYKIMPENPVKLKTLALEITRNIFDNIIRDPENAQLVKKSLEIYDQQISKKSKPFIMPEVTQIITNLANLGVPVAIVSNATQEIVDDFYTTISDTLPEDVRQKCRNKEWLFTKIGIQRDNDGDVVLSGKPAPDLLAVSLRKANKYNNKNYKKSIENVVFVGNSEAFDMRAADNFQRLSNATDSNIHVYKLLITHDNPEKTIRDRSFINNNGAMKNMQAINDRLMNAFEKSKNPV